MTLKSDLVFRIFVSRAYLAYYSVRNSKFGVCMHLGMKKCRVLSLVTVTLILTSDLVSRIGIEENGM